MRAFDDTLLDKLCVQSQSAARRRAHHLIHADHAENVQRLLIALQPDSYVQPHRHTQPPIWEHLVCVRGEILVLIVDDNGIVQERQLVPQGCSVEPDPAQWHTILATRPDSVVLEFKPGPFQPTPAENFAAWAPAEGDARVPTMLAACLDAQPGDDLKAAIATENA